ncbi:MAG TPA: NAD(P)H-dependent oxidoreductase [Candidatus Saccharimonadales bacterium]|nr:NAD(P)H-dependent oxidoreductase [Candidatus Saccharimonadales bacterium]
MNILIVYAHDEPASFTAAMKNKAMEVLSRQGHTVVLSDLYTQGFSPSAQKWDFVSTRGGHFNYMLEQKHAAGLDLAFSPDILGEIEKIKAAELVLFIFPIWWLSCPAILKGWYDRVLAMGVAWDSGKIFEAGLMRGKSSMIIAAAGGPADFYKPEGMYKVDINGSLHHINYGTLAFCGFNVHEPFTAMNVLGSGPDELTKQLGELEFRLEHLVESPNWLVRWD